MKDEILKKQYTLTQKLTISGVVIAMYIVIMYLTQNFAFVSGKNSNVNLCIDSYFPIFNTSNGFKQHAKQYFDGKLRPS